MTHPTSNAGIGSLSSTAAGSAARFNAGKPKLGYIPPAFTWAALTSAAKEPPVFSLTDAVGHMHHWYMNRGGLGPILNAFHALGCPLTETAAVFDYGAKKYAAWNWIKGMPYLEVMSSFMRHAEAMLDDSATELGIDPESGLPHVGHMGCNLVMLWQYQTTAVITDDRPIQVVPPAPTVETAR